MSFQERFQQLYTEGKITYLLIYDSDGNIYWTSQYGISEDGYRLLSDWMAFPQALEVWGRRYVVLVNSYPDYILATSAKKEGIIVLCRSKSKYVFLSVSPSGYEPTAILAEIFELAQLF